MKDKPYSKLYLNHNQNFCFPRQNGTLWASAINSGVRVPVLENLGASLYLDDTDGKNMYSLPTPYTLHPTPCTLHPTPHTLHLTSCTLHPTPHTLHPTSFTLHPTPYTLTDKAQTTHHEPFTLHPQPSTLNSKP